MMPKTKPTPIEVYFKGNIVNLLSKISTEDFDDSLFTDITISDALNGEFAFYNELLECSQNKINKKTTFNHVYKVDNNSLETYVNNVAKLINNAKLISPDIFSKLNLSFTNSEGLLATTLSTSSVTVFFDPIVMRSLLFNHDASELLSYYIKDKNEKNFALSANQQLSISLLNKLEKAFVNMITNSFFPDYEKQIVNIISIFNFLKSIVAKNWIYLFDVMDYTAILSKYNFLFLTNLKTLLEFFITTFIKTSIRDESFVTFYDVLLSFMFLKKFLHFYTNMHTQCVSIFAEISLLSNDVKNHLVSVLKEMDGLLGELYLTFVYALSKQDADSLPFNVDIKFLLNDIGVFKSIVDLSYHNSPIFKLKYLSDVIVPPLTSSFTKAYISSTFYDSLINCNIHDCQSFLNVIFLDPFLYMVNNHAHKALSKLAFNPKYIRIAVNRWVNLFDAVSKSNKQLIYFMFLRVGSLFMMLLFLHINGVKFDIKFLSKISQLLKKIKNTPMEPKSIDDLHESADIKSISYIFEYKTEYNVSNISQKVKEQFLETFDTIMSTISAYELPIEDTSPLMRDLISVIALFNIDVSYFDTDDRKNYLYRALVANEHWLFLSPSVFLKINDDLLRLIFNELLFNHFKQNHLSTIVRWFYVTVNECNKSEILKELVFSLGWTARDVIKRIWENIIYNDDIYDEDITVIKKLINLFFNGSYNDVLSLFYKQEKSLSKSSALRKKAEELRNLVLNSVKQPPRNEENV